MYLVYSSLSWSTFLPYSFFVLDSYISVGIATTSDNDQNIADSVMNLLVFPLSSFILQAIEILSTNQYKKNKICPRTLTILNKLSSSSNKILINFWY